MKLHCQHKLAVAVVRGHSKAFCNGPVSLRSFSSASDTPRRWRSARLQLPVHDIHSAFYLDRSVSGGGQIHVQKVKTHQVAASGQESDGSEEFSSLSQMTWHTFLLTEYKRSLSAMSQQSPSTGSEIFSALKCSILALPEYFTWSLTWSPIVCPPHCWPLQLVLSLSRQHGCYVDPERGLSRSLPPASSHGQPPPPSQPRRLHTSWHIYL